jgi:hypothetical protein
MTQGRSVLGYFDEVEGLTRPDIELWESTWRAQGWDPEVLTKKDIPKTDLADALLKRVKRFPTVNPIKYEVACWMRWAAAPTGYLLTDFDVLNRSFTPEDFRVLKLRNSKNTFILHPGRVPCAAVGGRGLVETMLAHEPEIAYVLGRAHYSDMVFFQHQFHAVEPMVSEVGSVGWELAPLVHFSTSSMTALGVRKDKLRSLAESLSFRTS